MLRPQIALPIGLLAVITAGCLGLGRLVPSSKEDDHPEKRAEEVASEHLQGVHGESVDAYFVGTFRREDGYIVLVDFVHNDKAARSEFATIAISKDWEVVAVDYTDEGRRLKDPMAITTEARENALPAKTTERLIRLAREQGKLPPASPAQ